MTIYVTTSWEKNMISAHTCKEQAQLQERITELEAENKRLKELYPQRVKELQGHLEDPWIRLRKVEAERDRLNEEIDLQRDLMGEEIRRLREALEEIAEGQYDIKTGYKDFGPDWIQDTVQEALNKADTK